MLEMLKECIPTGNLKDFPIEIIEKITFYQQEQTGKINLRIFESDLATTLKDGGFDWYKTPEGPTFWRNILTFRNFYIFFLKYPRPEDSLKLRFLEKYSIASQSFLSGLPLEILDKMIEYQVKQGNTANPEIFVENSTANKIEGGFDWCDTKEGTIFWSDVICEYKHYKFFKRYGYKVFPTVVKSRDKFVVLLNYNHKDKIGKGFEKNSETIKTYGDITYPTINGEYKKYKGFSETIKFLGKKMKNIQTGSLVFIDRVKYKKDKNGEYLLLNGEISERNLYNNYIEV